MRHAYDYSQDERELEQREIDQTLSAAIQEATAEAKRVCESFSDKFEFLQRRHQLVKEMERLEK